MIFLNSFKDPKVRRKMIMGHYKEPNNKNEEIEYDYVLHSQVCVDELHLKLDIEDGALKNANFNGVGCAVFLSSVDIFLDEVKGKTIEEVKEINTNYNNMIKQSGSYDLELLGNLAVYENVASNLNRLHCAEMISIAITANID